MSVGDSAFDAAGYWLDNCPFCGYELCQKPDSLLGDEDWEIHCDRCRWVCRCDDYNAECVYCSVIGPMMDLAARRDEAARGAHLRVVQ